MKLLSRLFGLVAAVAFIRLVVILVHNTFADPPFGPQGVVIDADEKAMYPRLLANGIETVNASKGNGTYRRDAHPKTHGCVKAIFDVVAVETPYKQALFGNAKRYNGWIRFSSGNPSVQPDSKPDARGMAVKVLDGATNAQGETTDQDFVMIDNPVFMLRNLEEYEQFMADQGASVVQKNNLLAFKYFFRGPNGEVTWNPLQWRLRELRLGMGILKSPPHSLLYSQFYSMTAYRLGSAGYVKFSARPVDDAGRTKTQKRLVGRDDNSLRNDLINRIQVADYYYDLLIQPQKPGRNMPVEDATVEWKESDSPFIKVARITIPKQAKLLEEPHCEDMSFSPWHGSPDVEPVGALNRARKMMYDGISAYRHEMNGRPVWEPKPRPE